MEVETSGMYTDKTIGGIWELIPNATYRFNKTIATATIRFIVTAAIFVYKSLIPVVYRMLTFFIPYLRSLLKNKNTHLTYNDYSSQQKIISQLPTFYS